MPTLDDFLKEHSRKLQDATESTSPGIVLTCILLAATDDEVVFGHLGVTFRAKRSDVVTVELTAPAIPNPFGAGVPCQLLFDPDAELSRVLKYKAAELLQNLPYGIERPSQIPSIVNPPSVREQTWLLQRGLITANVTADSSTYTRTDSAQNTATYSSSESGGVADDSYVDDSGSDSMPTDDANVDDISNLAVRAGAADTTYTR